MTRRAFTIVEVLVAIGIIGVLIALIVPALGKANATAKQTVALANVRSTGTVFDQYANDERWYPFRAGGDLPGAPDNLPIGLDPNTLYVSWWPRGTVVGVSGHWAHDGLWPAITVPLDDWPTHYPTWISPGGDTDLPEQSGFGNGAVRPENLVSIKYSNAFVARPALWSGAETGPVDRVVMQRPTAPHEVRYPSAKVLLWDAHLNYMTPRPEEREGFLDADTPMLFADHHGVNRNPLDATDPVQNPLNQNPPRRLHDTKDGVHGIDFN